MASWTVAVGGMTTSPEGAVTFHVHSFFAVCPDRETAEREAREAYAANFPNNATVVSAAYQVAPEGMHAAMVDALRETAAAVGRAGETEKMLTTLHAECGIPLPPQPAGCDPGTALAPVLTASAVFALAAECTVLREQIADPGVVTIDGFGQKMAVDPAKVAENAEKIAALLAELPVEFREGSGGGMSVWNATHDRHGNSWAPTAEAIDILCMLGIAAGKARWLYPREQWSTLPHGLPYVVISLGEAADVPQDQAA